MTPWTRWAPRAQTRIFERQELELLRTFVAIALTCAAGSALARTAADDTHDKPQRAIASHPGWPRAAAADTRSVTALVAAFDATLSAPKNGVLDRLRLRSLFVPDGRIVITARPKPGTPADVVFVTPDQYAALSDRMTAREGFFDRVVANGVERFGDIAHVESAYESRHALSDPAPFTRGIKSFELLHTDDEWRIVQVFYEREGADSPIPPAWLHDRTL